MDNVPHSQLQPLARRGQLALLMMVFCCGGAVMVVEILGTRIIGPVFGISLFVWSALLTVTLASLAAGYYAGGVLADRRPGSLPLAAVISAAGVLLGLAPLIRSSVLSATESLGPRLGPLLSALLLFGPCLALLGMVGPIAVRLATVRVEDTGHRVGAVYALSTAGSLAGTLLASFVLIPMLDTDQILSYTAILVTAVGALGLVRRARSVAMMTVLAPLLGLAPPTRELPSGLKILERAHSPYGLVEAIEDENRDVRLLRADHSIIGAQSTTDGSAAFAFLHLLEAIRFVRPHGTDLLQIGLGIGSLPMALRPFGVRADVVEIDPAVFRLAHKYFGFATAGREFVEDARTFVKHAERKYDIIVHDTFTGGTTPEHLLSLELISRLRALLRPDGILALNFVGYEAGHRAEATWAVMRTLRAVFRNVRAFRDGPATGPEEASNLTFFASDDQVEFHVPLDAKFENQACAHVLRTFQRWEVLEKVPAGAVITDDRNPLARLQLPIAEKHFQGMRELLPPQYWTR